MTGQQRVHALQRRCTALVQHGLPAVVKGLQRLLAQMVARRVGGVALEVSSHGLDQHRVDGTSFDVAAFTNLSQDHLDYHGTMQEYFAAKTRLFTGAFASRAAIGIDSKSSEPANGDVPPVPLPPWRRGAASRRRTAWPRSPPRPGRAGLPARPRSGRS